MPKAALDTANCKTEKIPPHADLTRSPTVAQLLSVFDSTPGEALVVPFDGDHDTAHQRTKSWRRTLDHLGYQLHYRNDRSRKCLLLWIAPTRKNHALALKTPTE